MSAPLWQRVLVGSNIKVTLARCVVLAAVSVVLFKFVLLPMWIDGKSMEPRYHTGGFTFINCLAYRRAMPQRGDVVGIRMPKTEALLMKRIIGLPGERVSIRRSEVYINGEPLDEPYVKFRASPPAQRPWRVEEVTLAEDEYFVIGDNRGMDQKLHAFGSASRDRIVGKVLF